jgi:hypothetical protein
LGKRFFVVREDLLIGGGCFRALHLMLAKKESVFACAFDDVFQVAVSAFFFFSQLKTTGVVHDFGF